MLRSSKLHAGPDIWRYQSLISFRSAAALANELKKMADEAEKGRPSLHSVKKHLANYQAMREERVSVILIAANALTRVQTLNTWMDKFVAWYFGPWSGDM